MSLSAGLKYIPEIIVLKIFLRKFIDKKEHPYYYILEI